MITPSPQVSTGSWRECTKELFSTSQKSTVSAEAHLTHVRINTAVCEPESAYLNKCRKLRGTDAPDQQNEGSAEELQGETADDLSPGAEGINEDGELPGNPHQSRDDEDHAQHLP